MRLTFCYMHVSPYHHVRLTALSRLSNVTVVEYGDTDGMAFKGYDGEKAYNSIRLQQSFKDASLLEMKLNETSPDVLLLPGWGYDYAISALSWALVRNVPVVVISDSYEQLDGQHLWRELAKSRILRLFSAGLAAGKRSSIYLAKLGMPKERIFTGCDVIDNRHFADGAEAAQRNVTTCREKLGLPKNYFLVVNRFVPEKNLFRLLQAYEGYRRAGAPGDWKLCLVGGGELREEILRCRAELGIEAHVLLAGPKNYEELPAYYSLAGSLVLASINETWGLVVNEAMAAGLPILVSHRCGCADDLVEKGRNGYTFDPYDVDALSAHMLKMAGGEYDLSSMANAGREIIARWSPEFCAENTLKAAEAALSAPRPRLGLLDKLLLKAARAKLSRNL